MENARLNIENGPDIVRLNFSRTIASDSGVWICELIVRSERHVVTSEGELILRGLAVIGTPLRHQLMLTVIGKFGCNYRDDWPCPQFREGPGGEANGQ